MTASLAIRWTVGEQPIEQPPGDGMVVGLTMASGTFYQFHEIDGEDLGTFHDPRGVFTVTCRRVKRPGCPLELDFRRVSGGGIAAAYIVFYQGDPTVADGEGYYNYCPEPDIGSYTATISGDYSGTIEVPYHYRFTRTRWCSWGAPEQWPFPLASPEQLADERLAERHVTTFAGHCESYTTHPYEPMGIANLRYYQPGTGVSQDMLLVTIPQAHYLASGDAAALATTLADAEAGNTFPYYWRDPATGALLDRCGEHPSTCRPPALAADNLLSIVVTGQPGSIVPSDTAVFDPDGASYGIHGLPATLPASGTLTLEAQTYCYPTPALPTTPAATLKPPVAGVAAAFDLTAPMTHGTGITLDTAHFPTPSYVPYLLTRDPYHLESVQAEAGYCGQPVRGTLNVMSVRAIAWMHRSIAQAVLATPNDVTGPWEGATVRLGPSWLLPRSSFQWALESFRLNNEQFLMRSPDAAIQNMRVYALYDTPGDVTLWQEDYFLWAQARTVRADPAFAPFVRWLVGQHIARLTAGSGWCPYIPTTYWTCLDMDRDKTGHNRCPDWAAGWALNSTWQSQIDGGNYLAHCPASLAAHDTAPNTSSDYLTTMRAALCAVRQQEVVNDVAGFTDAVDFFVAELDPLVLSGDRFTCWNRCIA